MVNLSPGRRLSADRHQSSRKAGPRAGIAAKAVSVTRVPASRSRRAQAPATAPSKCVPTASVHDWTFLVGMALLVVLLILYCNWDDTLASHFDLTKDFAYIEQSIYLVTRGHLSPYSTVQGYYLWQDHAAIVSAWFVALVFALWPHPVTLLVVQALAVVGSQAVAFLWMRELVAQRVTAGTLDRWRGGLLLGVGLLLLAADPWIVRALSFDFHWEAFSLFFALVAMRLIWLHRRSAWIWVLVAIVSSNLGATYVIGIGISCLFAGRAWRRDGAILLALGLAATIFISQIHADQGSAFNGYAYLLPGDPSGYNRDASVLSVVAGFFEHLPTACSVVWSHRASLAADVTVGGLLGVVWPWSIGITLVVLAESGLQSTGFYVLPGFQNLPTLIIIPIGTVAVLAWVLSRGPRARRRARRTGGASAAMRRALSWRPSRRDVAGAVLVVLVVLDAIGWSLVWLPRTASQWLLVSDAAAVTLSDISARIPASAEVIVSQGIAGPFAARSQVYPIQAPGSFPLRSKDVYVILAPGQGIESLPLPSVWDAIASLSAMRNVTTVADQNGVWAFRWHPDASQRSFTISAESAQIPAWAIAAPGAVTVTSGSPSQWRVVSNGPGELLSGAYWDGETSGLYRASVRYSSTGPLDLQVVDDSLGFTLETAHLPPSPRGTTTSFTFRLFYSPPLPVYNGWGPFSVNMLQATGDDLSLELDVPQPERASVYSVGIAPVI